MKLCTLKPSPTKWTGGGGMIFSAVLVFMPLLFNEITT